MKMVDPALKRGFQPKTKRIIIRITAPRIDRPLVHTVHGPKNVFAQNYSVQWRTTRSRPERRSLGVILE